MILLITNKEDITVDFIIKQLKCEKIEYYRLNTEDIPDVVDVLFDFTHNSCFLFDSIKNRNINLSLVTAVYFHRPEITQLNNLSISSQERLYLKNEIAFVLEGIYKFLKDKYWLNNVYHIREAENKVYQLQLAKKIGFTIPDSIISNIPTEISQMVKRCKNDCIIKPIKTGNMRSTASPKVIFTSRLKDINEEVSEDIKSFPVYLQEHIHKKFDLRCIVVGNHVFTAKIYSQDFEDAKVDWRKSEHILKHEIYTLPKRIENLCVDITKKLKLNFSAIDLVVDEKGEYVFLECNPNGQWAWIENRLSIPISKSILDLLIKKGENNEIAHIGRIREWLGRIREWLGRIREWFWPLLEGNAQGVGKKNIKENDCHFAPDEIDLLLEYMRRYVKTEENRIKETEEKARNLVFCFGLAISVLAVFIGNVFFLKKIEYKFFIIIMIFIIIIYLCRVGYFSIRALNRQKYFMLGFPEYMFTDDVNKKNKLLIDQYNCVRKNAETINSKVDNVAMAQAYFVRAIWAVVLITALMIILYIMGSGVDDVVTKVTNE